MSNYISLLRGINVSGHKLIKMDLLKSIYESLGFNNIKTYIQSGNIVFSCKKDDILELKEIIEKEIQIKTKFDVEVFIIHSNDYKKIISNNPFLIENIGLEQLYISFLSDIPNKEIYDSLINLNNSSDKFWLRGKTIYFSFPEGYSKTKFNNNFIEKKLKIKATTRNWKTCLKLSEMLNDIDLLT